MTDTSVETKHQYSMVERVARAIRDERLKRGEGVRRASGLDYQTARAVIEAMREPSGAMSRIGLAAIESAQHNFGSVGSLLTIDDCWRAMIDAALGGKP